jgi:hypothetical protein
VARRTHLFGLAAPLLLSACVAQVEGDFRDPDSWDEASEEEVEEVVEELLLDSDRDGVADPSDNCPSIANADQANRNGVGAGDACELVLSLGSSQSSTFASRTGSTQLSLGFIPFALRSTPDLMRVLTVAPAGASAAYTPSTRRLGVRSSGEVSGADTIKPGEVLSVRLGAAIGTQRAFELRLRLSGTASVEVQLFNGATAVTTQRFGQSGTSLRTLASNQAFNRADIRVLSGTAWLVGSEGVLFSLGLGSISCPSGAERVGERCFDVDGCASQPCGTGTCLDRAPPASGYDCVCPAGYASNGTTCVDANACVGNPCGVSGVCTDRAAPASGYDCACAPGYAGNGTTCVDVNGCVGNPCGVSGVCTDRAAPDSGYTCACPAGYVSNGTTCVNANSCLGNPCGVYGVCTDRLPPATGYTCACPAGYASNGVTCVLVP